MELTYNQYNEPIYDKKYFDLIKSKNILLDDLIYLKNQVSKVINISHSKKKYSNKMYVECVNIFTNEKLSDIFPNNYDILIPIIHVQNYNVFVITNKIISLFDENNNTIIDVDINANTIENALLHKIDIDNIVTVVKFKNLIKIIKIIQ